ncbi:MAG: phosphoenolpyruvate--protein phosphotransferase [Pseudomonadota bacterium]|nr:phosphoenolpyruvate--protein phosphotransferase [Pseudomonadota bacterium]
MKTVIGKPISPGYAQGRAVVMGVGEAEVPERHITQNEIDHEIARFQRALEDGYRELQRLQDRVQVELGPSQADIFSAHLLFLRDRQFIDRVESCIKDDRLNVESAIKVTVAALARMLSAAENEYLRERAEDIKDLGRRLIRHITEFEARQLTRLGPETVLVARELLPSDLLELDRKHIVGSVTELGGETGHAAILARALGVPAVTGVPDATRIARPDMPILLDGQTGEVVFDPLPERVASSIANKESYDRVTSHVVSAEERECITQDGVKVRLYANIGRPCEVDQVIKHHLEGVGLFRTEYLFLDEPIAPSFERQRELYRQIAASLGKRPLVIRTLDLGGDKQPAFLGPQFEANPNLGIRGLRFSLLTSQELFRTQIRALLHVGNDYDVRIMLPMVLGGADLRHAIAIMREVAEEEGIPELPPIGVLVETPAAVFAINEILAASDFVSVGTNDLTQFILAADRNALAMIDDYTVLHPSVLRAVRWVIEAADGAGKPVSVCGEAAADPRVACLLVGLGVRRLSMSPISAPRVRYALRASYLRTLKELADAALACDSAETVSAMLTDTLKDTLPGPAPAGISV